MWGLSLRTMSATLLPDARDPAPLLQTCLADWDGGSDVWVFAYGSLIWRPDFEFVEQRRARVHGWHRSLSLRSRVNRGSPERPGLVLTLLSGGACQGLVYRIAGARVLTTFDQLWAREMPSGAYDPRWLKVHTPQGPVTALGFTLNRRSPHWMGALSEQQRIELLAQARGRYGTTLDYLLDTVRALEAMGIQDRRLQAWVSLAREAGLTDPPGAPSVTAPRTARPCPAG